MPSLIKDISFVALVIIGGMLAAVVVLDLTSARAAELPEHPRVSDAAVPS